MIYRGDGVIYWAMCPNGGVCINTASWTMRRTISSSWGEDRYLSAWTGVADIWSIVRS
jgi:hypothetical protein